MKSALRAVCVIALCLASDVGFAERYTIFGEPDCGEWVKQQNATHKAWLLGFLTGLSAMDAADRAAAHQTVKHDALDHLNSADQAFVWMDNYCRANPLQGVAKGATQLYIELKRE